MHSSDWVRALVGDAGSGAHDPQVVASGARRTAFHRSIIRSDARLDYPQVDRIFGATAARRQERRESSTLRSPV